MHITITSKTKEGKKNVDILVSGYKSMANPVFRKTMGLVLPKAIRKQASQLKEVIKIDDDNYKIVLKDHVEKSDTSKWIMAVKKQLMQPNQISRGCKEYKDFSVVASYE